MQVAVIHTAFEDAPHTVAFVEVGDSTGNDALEYAPLDKQRDGSPGVLKKNTLRMVKKMAIITRCNCNGISSRMKMAKNGDNHVM